MADPLPVVVRKADFIREFQKLAPHRHRYEVFRDFVHMSAFSLVNAWPYTRSEAIEAEFEAIKAKYSPEEFTGFTRLLALLRELLEPEPRDISVFVNKVVRFSKRSSLLFLAPSDARAAGSATPL